MIFDNHSTGFIDFDYHYICNNNGLSGMTPMIVHSCIYTNNYNLFGTSMTIS